MTDTSPAGQDNANASANAMSAERTDLPERSYLSRPPTGVVVLPPAYAPNSSVPKFLRLLALVVFFGGGSILSLVTWAYKNIMFPRLLATKGIMTSLAQGERSHFEQLTTDVRTLHSSMAPRLGGTASERADGDKAIKEGKNPDSTGFADQIRATNDVLRRIVAASQDAGRRPPSQPVLSSDSDSSASEEEDGATTLASSVDRLHESLERRQIDYWRPAIANDSKFAAAVSSVRSEIRAMKGALLNRRNFNTYSGRTA